MKIKDTYKCAIPTWALDYLVNGETSGLAETDLATVRKWEESWGRAITVSVADETPYFSGFPEFGPPCDVEDCEIVTYGEDE